MNTFLAVLTESCVVFHRLSLMFQVSLWIISFIHFMCCDENQSLAEAIKYLFPQCEHTINLANILI